MKISRPPVPIIKFFEQLKEKPASDIEEYMRVGAVVDEKGQYLPFDELKYRIKKGLDHQLVWSMVKSSRSKASNKIRSMGDAYGEASYVQTSFIQQAMSRVDREASHTNYSSLSQRLGEGERLQYLLSDLYQEESISSSQLEGAATTTIVAKEMLQQQRLARTLDEKMIIGNFRLMEMAWGKRDEELSIELLKSFHRIGVAGIEDEKYCPGEFRSDNNVCVEDGDGNIVHQPPSHESLHDRINELVEWANQDHEDVAGQLYIHPLIKAVVLHFSIGFEHPFRDGNGRVARTLFYWYMFKKGYGLFKYISISALLKKAPTAYGKSYIHTEQDDMDMTYFIEYQCDVIVRALSKFNESVKKKIQEIENFELWVFKQGIYAKLSEKQRTLFSVANSGVRFFTAREVEKNLGCSYNTAAKALNGLVELKLFDKNKEGKEWVYFMRDKDNIVSSWAK